MRRRITVFALLLLLALLCAVALRTRPGESPRDTATGPQPAAGTIADTARNGRDPARAPGSGETPKEDEKLISSDSGQPKQLEGGANSRTIRSLLRRQNEDGSWGNLSESFEGRVWSREEATALVLLAILGTGYSPAEKGWLGDRCVGDAIRAGIAWLEAHRPADASGIALVALALAEAAGMTGDPAMTRAANDALARLTPLQCSDGTWDGDALAARFATMALASARIGEIPQLPALTERAAARLRERLATGPDPDATIQLLWLTKEISDEGRASVVASCAANPPDISVPSYTRWYSDTIALFRADGPRGEAWKSWCEAIRLQIVPASVNGSWPGDGGATSSAIRDALAALTIEIYYRFSTAPAVKAAEEEKSAAGK